MTLNGWTHTLGICILLTGLSPINAAWATAALVASNDASADAAAEATVVTDQPVFDLSQDPTEGPSVSENDMMPAVDPVAGTVTPPFSVDSSPEAEVLSAEPPRDFDEEKGQDVLEGSAEEGLGETAEDETAEEGLGETAEDETADEGLGETAADETAEEGLDETAEDETAEQEPGETAEDEAAKDETAEDETVEDETAEQGLGETAEEGLGETAEDQTAEQGLDQTLATELTTPEQIAELEARLEAQDAELREAKKKSFVKGWLAGVGDVDFVSEKHRFIVGFQMYPTDESAGKTLTNRTYYLAAVPQISLHFGRLYTSFELPLAFELFNIELDSTDDSYAGGTGFNNAGHFAGVQWQDAQEYAQIIRYIRLGNKEDDLYLNISKYAAATIGHGTQMRRYNPNIDLDHARVSGQLDKSFHYGGFELYTSDVFSLGSGGMLAYAKPGKYFLPDNLMTRSASFGFTWLYDRAAPNTLVHDQTNGLYLVAAENRTPEVADTSTVKIMGFDLETKVFEADELNVKTYVDYSRLMNTGGGGLTAGGLLRVNLGGDAYDARIHAFRVRAEAGLYHARYSPGYFDTFYEIQKFQYDLGSEEQAITKLAWLAQQEGGYRPGARVEATYAISNSIGMSASWQGSTGGRDDLVMLHLEVPASDYLRLLATYARTNLGDGSPFFALDNPNALLIGRARLKLLPVLFLNTEVSQMYRLSSATSTTEDVVYGPEVGSAAQFENVFRWDVEVEVGFEF